MLEETINKMIKGFNSIESVHLNVKHKDTGSVIDLKGSENSFSLDVNDEKFNNIDFEFKIDMKESVKLPDPNTTRVLNKMYENLYIISSQLEDADNKDEIIELLMIYAEYHNDSTVLESIIDRLGNLSEKDRTYFSDVINMIDPE